MHKKDCESCRRVVKAIEGCKFFNLKRKKPQFWLQLFYACLLSGLVKALLNLCCFVYTGNPLSLLFGALGHLDP